MPVMTDYECCKIGNLIFVDYFECFFSLLYGYDFLCDPTSSENRLVKKKGYKSMIK